MRRVIAEVRPTWVIGENVTGIIRMELDTVLSDLEALGYACRTFIVPAAAVDAPHIRARVWVLARDTNENSKSVSTINAKASWVSGDMANANSEQMGRIAKSWQECNQWRVEPDMGRVANGVPRRVDRLRALGNAVVPQIPEMIGRAIMEAA